MDYKKPEWLQNYMNRIKDNLSEFLKDNLTPKEYILKEENHYFYYDWDSKRIEADFSTDIEYDCLYFNDISIEIKYALNESRVTMKQLHQAFKELGWIKEEGIMNLRKEYGLIKEKLILLKMERNKTEEIQLQINLLDAYLSVLSMRIDKECPEFNLVEFLKANLVHTEFKKGDKVRYFSYDEKSIHPLRYHIDSTYTIGAVYFTDSLDDEVVEVLNENGVTARDLNEAFKELGWI